MHRVVPRTRGASVLLSVLFIVVVLAWVSMYIDWRVDIRKSGRTLKTTPPTCRLRLFLYHSRMPALGLDKYNPWCLLWPARCDISRSRLLRSSPGHQVVYCCHRHPTVSIRRHQDTRRRTDGSKAARDHRKKKHDVPDSKPTTIIHQKKTMDPGYRVSCIVSCQTCLLPS